jgi:prepilin-type processing-associated H-X9-DG protein
MYTRQLTKRDAGVTVVTTLFVLCILSAVGLSGRGRAKETICQANLHEWEAVFQGYIEQNNGKFLSGCNASGYWWPIQLSFEQQNWKRNRTWFCPTATTPIVDEKGVSSTTVTIDNAWGIFRPSSMTYQGKTYVADPNGLSGSYGLNGFTLNIPETGMYEGNVPATYGWRDLTSVPNGNSVPMFIDASRFDLWPLATDAPPPVESVPWPSNGMACCCINRHDGAVNCLFVDGSVRKVGLKELWTLKWHKSFNTAGPWTKAGGVRRDDWPEWMRQFKDY